MALGSVNRDLGFSAEKIWCASNSDINLTRMETDFAAQLRKLGLRVEDVEETFQRSSGPGGQNVNKVSTAVTLVHRPSGFQLTVQDHRSQLANRQLARERFVAAFRQQRADARNALKHEREKTRRANRPKPRGLKRRILDQKKQRGQTKQLRKRVE